MKVLNVSTSVVRLEHVTFADWMFFMKTVRDFRDVTACTYVSP